MSSLKNQISIVTGASSGIGAAIAKALAAEGSKVVLAARSTDKLLAVSEEISSSGGSSLAVEADVSREDSVVSLFKKVEAKFGRLDLLINNAGIALGGPTEELDFSAWRKLMNVNVDGVFLCSREAFKLMKEAGRGRIINIGSVSAKMPRVHSAPYTTSKFALEGLTRSLALDGRAYGISVGVLQPGNVMTAIWEGREEKVASEGAIEPDDLAKVAVAMAALPDGVSMLDSTILPISMPFLGRG